MIRPLVLTEKWRSVNDVRFGDPSILFGFLNYMAITIKTIRTVTTFAKRPTLLQGLPSLDAFKEDPTGITPK